MHTAKAETVSTIAESSPEADMHGLLMVVQGVAEIVLGGLAPGVPASHAGIAGAEQGVRVVAVEHACSWVPQGAILGHRVGSARVTDLAQFLATGDAVALHADDATLPGLAVLGAAASLLETLRSLRVGHGAQQQEGSDRKLRHHFQTSVSLGSRSSAEVLEGAQGRHGRWAETVSGFRAGFRLGFCRRSRR